MKSLLVKTRKVIIGYLKWGWPILLLDIVLAAWKGDPVSLPRNVINTAAFIWVLCAPVAAMCFLLDRAERERLMARLCGVHEGDERERMITGEAARNALLLSLSLQVVLLVATLITVNFTWNPDAPKDQKHGTLSVGLGVTLSRLNPLGLHSEKNPDVVQTEKGNIKEISGNLLTPSMFPVLAALILIQLLAFRVFAARRYQGAV